MNKFNFLEKTPKHGDYITLFWADGSECDAVYNEFAGIKEDLPTHWCYVEKKLCLFCRIKIFIKKLLK